MEREQKRGQKRELRRQLLAQRQRLTIAQWQHQSRLLCDRLISRPQVQKAGTVLAYHSHRQEPDLSPLWHHSQWSTPKVWGLPRCIKSHESDKKPTQLSWHQWQPGVPLVEGGYYGLREPDPAWAILETVQVNLILVPMVAGDRRGYRLGYGGGFYDRLFSQPQWQKIPTVGITFEAMLVDQLPTDPWDHPLDAICTERQWLSFSEIFQ